tara:strand:+ start:2126 stop:2512 length:387 start_codon:yes stop_codon:yes gene_type:complete
MDNEEVKQVFWDNLQYEEYKKLTKQHPSVRMSTVWRWSCEYAQENFDVLYDDAENKKYLAMYGCTKQDMEDMMHEDRPYMLAMCILSDAQHVMEYDTEQARQFINKAKYVIRHMNRPTLDTLTPTTTN